MSDHLVGISDMHISDQPNETIVTYSLGSCIGITAFDPVRKIGGMIHYMLPSSTIAPDKARVKPAMFADTGVPLLLNKLLSMGAAKGRLVIKVAGGAQLMDDKNVFNIGERNIVMLRKILWANSLLIKGQHVGENYARTLRLEIGTGRVTVKCIHGEIEL